MATDKAKDLLRELVVHLPGLCAVHDSDPSDPYGPRSVGEAIFGYTVSNGKRRGNPRQKWMDSWIRRARRVVSK